jgi:hypothetical protein
MRRGQEQHTGTEEAFMRGQMRVMTAISALVAVALAAER